MVYVKIKKGFDGYDCWGRLEPLKTVYDIYTDTMEFICRTDDLPKCTYTILEEEKN